MAVHVQLIGSTVLYFCTFLSGLVITIGLAIVKGKLAGKCVLYIDILDGPSGSDNNSTTITGKSAICELSMYLPVLTSLYAFGMAGYYGYAALVAFREQHIGRMMWIMPWLLANSLITVVTFIAACIFSIGFHQTCTSLRSKFSSKNEQCRELLAEINPDSLNAASSSTTYNAIQVVQAAYWISVLLWIVVFVVSVVRLMRNLRARSAATYNEPTTSDVRPIAEMEPTA